MTYKKIFFEEKKLHARSWSIIVLLVILLLRYDQIIHPFWNDPTIHWASSTYMQEEYIEFILGGVFLYFNTYWIAINTFNQQQYTSIDSFFSFLLFISSFGHMICIIRNFASRITVWEKWVEPGQNFFLVLILISLVHKTYSATKAQ